jgi:hypothetical protein
MRSGDAVSPASCRASGARWTHRITAAVVATTAALLVLSSVKSEPRNEGTAGVPARTAVDPACDNWSAAASEAVARLVQQSKQDVDLRQINDMIFLLRRARRNCEAGWIGTACLDFRAIIRSAPETARRFTSGCWRATAGGETRRLKSASPSAA